ncbi:hypothetical protein GOL94_00180 [Sinorhizobium medicae]|nr:hypothetical protein [Sinorhizobium medicae]
MTIDDLVAEASALWKAEAPNAKRGALGSTWGSVGVLFRESTSNKGLAESWRAHFEKTKTSARGVVQPDGSLNIPWPTEGGAALDFDLILATATVPEPVVPSPEAVAKAILSQNEGHENYFLNNVLHGIKTASDEDIFTAIYRESPDWISAEKYRDAIGLLRGNPGAA